jgi:hypothetical protein
MAETTKTGSAERVGIVVKLESADVDALRSEAFARVQRRESNRFSISQVVRDVVAAWREQRQGQAS